MNQRFPQDDSPEGIEGTAAHWVAWEVLANNFHAPGAKTPNGVIVTDEMVEGGRLVADTINDRLRWTDGNKHIEEKLSIPYVPGCFGTPDFWAFNPSNLHIEIVDYKFGHRFVDEFFNPQGLLYMTGIIEGIMHGQPVGSDWTVSFTVVQPRCFYKGISVRTHSFHYRDARPYLQKLWDMSLQAIRPEPTATTNEYCGDCPGRHACSALQQAAYSDVEFSNRRTPIMLSPVAAALELRMLMRALDRIQARVDGLKEQTIQNIRAGRQVNYFRAELGFGRQQWTIPDSQVVSLGKLYGQNLATPGVLTPKQAITAGVDSEIVKANSFVPSTGFKLIAENPLDAPRTFGTLREGE